MNYAGVAALLFQILGCINTDNGTGKERKENDRHGQSQAKDGRLRTLI